MANQLPYQILMIPFSVYIAPIGTARPLVNNPNPATPWKLLGTSGTEDYDDDGVTITHDQKFGDVRGAGSTGVRKVTRTEEDLTISLKLIDVTLDQYMHALNENGKIVTLTATGVPASEGVRLYQGVDVVFMSLLVRGYSPKSGDANSFRQYWLPSCYQSGKPKVQAAKGKAQMLELEFTALSDPFSASTEDRFGFLEDYTAAAS
jgi:hypothetical protein